MAKRHQNPRLAKIHRSYKVDEITDLYGAHKNTVLNWIKKGLPTLDNKRPLLIQGRALNAFHAKKRVKNKQPCNLDELFCMRCKAPKKPVEDLVEYQTINEKTGNVIGVCPTCHTLMYRRISNTKIQQFSIHMGFSIP
ncbi:MAG TPA: DNA-binding protein [Methylophilaceae bacterium]|nr:DNA-binding protein [Methylophilaceae bacterium]HAJ70474.1 DNA-binding protein [Methylophilaceae bacterium]